MKRAIGVLICVLWIRGSAQAQVVDVDNNTTSNLNQATSLIGGGASNSDSYSSSDSYATGGAGVGVSDSSSSVNISTTSNYKNRTSPMSAGLPYLPLWNHGGWGTVKGYFANGPSNNLVYERSFNPRDPQDMDQLRGILLAVPYSDPLKIIPGLFNNLSAALGGPDRFHHGRGFDIANSVIRHRRPNGKPLMAFIDSEIDRTILQKAGYTYVGKVSVEGNENLNWDQTYNATIAECLPWDVDIVLLSGGMKGVTVGTNQSFPNGAFGYGQTNYSLSLVGGMAKGITEGKGKPVVSAEAYRYSPRLSFKQSVPRQFYQSLQTRVARAEARAQERTQERAPETRTRTTYVNPTGGAKGVSVSRELYDLAGFSPEQRVDYMSVAQTQTAP